MGLYLYFCLPWLSHVSVGVFDLHTCWMRSWLTTGWHVEVSAKWTTFCRQHFQIYIFLFKKLCILLEFVSSGPTDNKSSLVWVTALFPVAQLTIRHHWFGSQLTTRLKWVEYGVHIIHVLNFWCLNTLRPIQNGQHFTDDTFKCVFLNENIRILINILLKFVPYGPLNNIPSLVQIMAWHQPGDKPLSETMMVYLTDAYMPHLASMS